MIVNSGVFNSTTTTIFIVNNLRSNQLPRALKEIYILLLPYVRFAHMINKRSIATIKASFIVALDRLLLIDYCITNPAVIK